MLKLLALVLLWPVIGAIFIIASCFKIVFKVRSIDPKRSFTYFIDEILDVLESFASSISLSEPEESSSAKDRFMILCQWPIALPVIQNLGNEAYIRIKSEYDSGVRQKLP